MVIKASDNRFTTEEKAWLEAFERKLDVQLTNEGYARFDPSTTEKCTRRMVLEILGRYQEAGWSVSERFEGGEVEIKR